MYLAECMLVKVNKNIGNLLIGSVLGLLCNCYNITSLQNASLLPQKTYEFTGYYTTETFYNRTIKESDFIASDIGFSWNYGISEYLNTRASYSLIIPNFKFASDVHYFSLGIKFPVLKDYIAGYLPIGLYYGKDLSGVSTTFIQPTIITSLPMVKFLKMNASISEIIFFNKAASILVGTIGIDITNLIENIAVTPEFSIASNGSMRGMYCSFSLGISYLSHKVINKNDFKN